MAALTATSTLTTNAGANTLLIVSLTIGSTSDTYTIAAGSPIIGAWVSGIIGECVTYVASTGVFTLTNASVTGAVQLFILLAGC
jgi:hypothetical protein